MKLTIKKIKDVYNVLSEANASKLNDTEFKKVLAILKKLYPLQAEAKEDAQRAIDLAKPADWEEIQELLTKVQAETATPEESVRAITANGAFNRRVESIITDINRVEHDIDIEPISEELADKIAKESGFTFAGRMALMPVVE